MNTSHAGSKKNAGLLRAHVAAFLTWNQAREDMADFLDGLTVEVPQEKNANPEDSAPTVVQLLNGEIKAEGVKLRRGGMFVSIPKATERYRELSGDMKENRGIMNDTQRRLTRSLGRDADKAIADKLSRSGWRPKVAVEPDENKIAA